jgi:biotin transport system substrate-specific component
MKGLTVRGVVFSALFAAVLVAFSYVSMNIGSAGVPITLENMAVMLAGAILGAQYGFISMALVVVLTAVGVPMLHGQGGWGVISGYTGGYIWAWPFCALLTGWAVSKINGNGIWALIRIFVVIEVFGSLLCYVTGVPWLAHVMHLSFGQAMAGGCYPYLLGDALKAAITALIVIPVRQVYPVSRIIHGMKGQVLSI